MSFDDDEDEIPSHEFVGPRRPFVRSRATRRHRDGEGPAPMTAVRMILAEQRHRHNRRFLVFCDADGIWHPKHGQRFTQLPLLEAWLAKRPEVMLVLTTSWREQQPLDRLREFFSPAMRKRVIDVTPVVKSTWWTKAPRYVRYVEIQQWLATAEVTSEMAYIGRRQSWAILDDQADLFPPGCENLVLVDGNRGLQEADLDRLNAVLGTRWKAGR